MRVDLRNSLPFFGEDLIGSAETALGATIFTAALADCGLVKKAMVGLGVKRRAVRPMKWRGGKQTPTTPTHPGPPCPLLPGIPQHQKLQSKMQTSPPGTLIKHLHLLLNLQLHRIATLARKRSGQNRACLVLRLSIFLLTPRA